MEYRLSSVETAVRQIAEAVQQIAASTTQIARIEERHSETRESLDRAFKELRDIKAGTKVITDEIDDRVKGIEIKMPGLEEMRGFMIRGIMSIIGIVGAAVVALVIISK